MSHSGAEKIIVRDSQFMRNTVIGLVIASTGVFGWSLYTLNSHDKAIAADDVKWSDQAEKHAAIESFERETAKSVSEINQNLQQIRIEIVLLRHDLGLDRNMAAKQGKQGYEDRSQGH